MIYRATGPHYPGKDRHNTMEWKEKRSDEASEWMDKLQEINNAERERETKKLMIKKMQKGKRKVMKTVTEGLTQ